MPEVSNFTYDRVGSFFGGLAKAEKDGRWLHIRHDGSPAYEERFDLVSDFVEGLAWADKGRQRFHIRPDGSRVD